MRLPGLVHYSDIKGGAWFLGVSVVEHFYLQIPNLSPSFFLTSNYGTDAGFKEHLMAPGLG